LRKSLPVTGIEVLFNNEKRIISNTKGEITSINQSFLKISSFREDTLIGQAHNLVQHTNMPQAVSTDLRATL